MAFSSDSTVYDDMLQRSFNELLDFWSGSVWEELVAKGICS